ncbi:MAG TPA: methionyl-tRNA formyltransferase [Vicinamibacterales bacterium]|nr:methionyl-tRNA formyltransferase [Vicinamibacterales bacterium]
MVTTSALRIVFFGTPQFAVPAFDALLRSHHSLVGVVTRVDRPRGRGQKTTDAPIKARAVQARLAILQPEKLSDPTFLDRLRALHADLGVVVAYGKILTDAVLAIPRLGLVNVHASLLPKYRGAAPVHRAVIAGESETGVTIMRVVKALDAGPMLARARRPIGPDDTSDDLERDLAARGAALLVETVDAIAAGSAHEESQDDSAATYAPRLTKDDGIVEWSATAAQIHNQIRGLRPWPHAFTFHGGRRLILLRSSTRDVGAATGPPGAILDASGDRLIVATGAGALRLTEIQSEGKRPMAVRDFLAGHRLAVGDRLSAAP